MRILSIIIVLFSALKLAYCAPTGLNVIPTAEVFDYGFGEVEFGSTGDTTKFLNGSGITINTEAGPLRNIELGYDFGVSSDTVSVANLKYARPFGHDRYAAAIGFQDWGDDSPIQPYVVSLANLKYGRGHLGIIYDGQLQPMVGYDIDLSEILNFRVDSIMGENSQSGVGFEIGFGKSVDLDIGYLWGGTTDSGYLFTLSYGFPIGKHKKTNED